MKNKVLKPVLAVVVFVMASSLWYGSLQAQLPVKAPDNNLYPQRESGIRNLITWQGLHNVSAGSSPLGMTLNLGKSSLKGTIYSGQYPFEFGSEPGTSIYPYTRFDESEEFSGGVGIIHFRDYMEVGTDEDVNDWVAERQGDGQCGCPADCPTTTMAYRVEIDIAEDLPEKFKLKGESDIYDGRQSFTCGQDCRTGPWKPLPTIVLGPMVCKVTSDRPGKVTIALETDEPCYCTVDISRTDKFKGSGPSLEQEIEITGLKPDNRYTYQVACRSRDGRTVRSGRYHFRTAPDKGSSRGFCFAFASDSREGAVGESAVMGHNKKTLMPIATDAYRKGADLFIFGGDLVNGYTTMVQDFRMQLKAWKQSMEGYWRFCPVYTAMGNHETLINKFGKGSCFFASGVCLDKWPYETHSAEAVFAQEFCNPENGPKPGDGRLPPYRENVYSFQYASALFIAFNNNYWWSSHPETYGGSPEGYILADQLNWLENTLERAEQDSSVRYIFLYGQEPVFPAGGHPEDAMWWHGNNKVRAFKKEGVKMKAAGQGIIEVRNRFWEAVAESRKVAAVLTGDEHNYQRKLITSKTPVGIPALDDKDRDGKLETYSANPKFTHPTYEITAGHAGAPFYAQEDVPWKEAVQLFSSRIGYLLFRVTPDGVSMTSYAGRGDLIIDHVENLMEVKAGSYPTLR